LNHATFSFEHDAAVQLTLTTFQFLAGTRSSEIRRQIVRRVSRVVLLLQIADLLLDSGSRLRSRWNGDEKRE
jgi:hypothetical protein